MHRLHLPFLCLPLLLIAFVAPAQSIPTNVTATQQAGNVLRYEVQFSTTATVQGFVEYAYWDGVDSIVHHTGASALGTSHVITVLGLIPQTTYRYRAIAFDSLGCVASPWGSFTVAAVPVGVTVGHVLTVNGTAGDPPGYLLSNTQRGDPDCYLQIHDRKGHLIWYERMPGIAAAAYDGPCQHYSYQPSSHSIFVTECDHVSELALDGTVLRSVQLSSIAPGWMAHHDVVRIPNGNWLVLVARLDTIDKSSVGGDPAALVVGPGILEIDPSGALVWSWSAFDHLDPLESPAPGGDWVPRFGSQAVNWLDANAVMQDGDGNPMLSFGDRSTVVKIVRSGGGIVWTLGLDGTIEILPPDTFAHQNALRNSRAGYYLSFDNQGLGAQSRVIEWWIDFSYINPRLEISRAHVLPPADYSADDGNLDRLPSGNWVIGSSGGRSITEITANGSVLWHAVLDSSLYRAYWVDDFYARLRPRYTGETLVCLGDSVVALRASVAGGIWSGAYVRGDSFDAAAAGLGLHEVTYKLGPESFTVELEVDPSLLCGVGMADAVTPTLAMRVFPNPLGMQQETFQIQWTMARAEQVVLEIYGLDGRPLGTRDLGVLPMGTHATKLLRSTLGQQAGAVVVSLRTASGKHGRCILVVE
jgi:arylsulfate sulfotransferase